MTELPLRAGHLLGGTQQLASPIEASRGSLLAVAVKALKIGPGFGAVKP